MNERRGGLPRRSHQPTCSKPNRHPWPLVTGHDTPGRRPHACQFERQVYGIEIVFAWTRRRPTGVGEDVEMLAAKPASAIVFSTPPSSGHWRPLRSENASSLCSSCPAVSARHPSLAGLTLSSLLDEAREHAGRLAKHFGTRPIIVGHSNGALLALALALAGLGEASAVGLIAPAPPPSVPGAPMWVRRLLFSRVFGQDWDTRAVRFRPGWPLAGETPQGPLARSLCPDSGTVMAESLAPGHRGVFDPAPLLPCPVAVVAGSRDKLVPPALARKLAERFDARHHEVQAAGHWLIGDLRHADLIDIDFAGRHVDLNGLPKMLASRLFRPLLLTSVPHSPSRR